MLDSKHPLLTISPLKRCKLSTLLRSYVKDFKRDDCLKLMLSALVTPFVICKSIMSKGELSTLITPFSKVFLGGDGLKTSLEPLLHRFARDVEGVVCLIMSLAFLLHRLRSKYFNGGVCLTLRKASTWARWDDILM